MKIDYANEHVEPREYPYPINGGKIERRRWEENHARCEWYKHYPIGGGKVERLAWERAHGWDR